jgi:hypothetical protein
VNVVSNGRTPGIRSTTHEDSGLHTRRHACALKHNIHLANAVDLTNSLSSLPCYRQILIDILSSLHRNEVTCVRESILNREIQPSLIDIRDDNLLCTLNLRHSRTQQPDSSSTINHHSRALRHQAPSESMQRNPKRLQQRSHIQAHLLGELITPLRRMINPLLQRSLEMRETLSTAPEPQLFADVVSPFCTAGTVPAWNADFEGDLVAFFEICYARADR